MFSQTSYNGGSFIWVVKDLYFFTSYYRLRYSELQVNTLFFIVTKLHNSGSIRQTVLRDYILSGLKQNTPYICCFTMFTAAVFDINNLSPSKRNIQCTMYLEQCTMYNVQYNVQCTFSLRPWVFISW